MDKVWSSIISDLLINLSAGWVGLVIVVPSFTTERGLRKFAVLFWDAACAIVSLLFAYLLRSNL